MRPEGGAVEEIFTEVEEFDVGSKFWTHSVLPRGGKVNLENTERVWNEKERSCWPDWERSHDNKTGKGCIQDFIYLLWECLHHYMSCLYEAAYHGQEGGSGDSDIAKCPV